MYSLMARFAIVLGQELNEETAPHVTLKLVNLDEDNNLSEEYLTTVNPRGQVPALTSTELSTPLAESRDIARWLCEKQPELVPDQYRQTIAKLMDKLYTYHAKALNVPPDGIPNKAAAMLEEPNLTQAHRRALEIKSIFHETLHSRTVDPQNVQLVEANTRELMIDLAKVIEEHGDGTETAGIWIFGDKPTILDAYATVLALRLTDVKRLDLVPETMQQYAHRVSQTEMWSKVAHGRPTVWNSSLGRVADFEVI